MASMIWMFIDDNDDDFKIYQRAFRKMEIKNSEDKLLSELEEVKNERAGYEKKLSAAQKSFDGRQDELTQAISFLEDISKFMPFFFEYSLIFLIVLSPMDLLGLFIIRSNARSSLSW